MGFIRRFVDQSSLKKETLFRSRLEPDVSEPFSPSANVRGDVFPAIRVDRIDFYHKGGNLFSYSARRGFTTHHTNRLIIV